MAIQTNEFAGCLLYRHIADVAAGHFGQHIAD